MRKLLDPSLFTPAPSLEGDLAFWVRFLKVSSGVSRDVGAASFLEFHNRFSVSEVPCAGVSAHDWKRLVFQMNPVPPLGDHAAVPEEAARVADYDVPTGAPSVTGTLIDDLSQGEEAWELVSLSENWSCERHGNGSDLDPVFVENADYRLDPSGVRPPLLISFLSDDYSIVPWGDRLSYIYDGPTSMDAIEDASSVLFPALKFSDEAWARWKSIGKEERYVAPRAFHHLCVLNDVCAEIWRADSDERTNRFGHFGVNASGEGSATRRSKKKIKERDFSFDGTVVRCEWHTKFWPTEGRIHFEVIKGVVHVGCIVRHLPT